MVFVMVCFAATFLAFTVWNISVSHANSFFLLFVSSHMHGDFCFLKSTFSGGASILMKKKVSPVPIPEAQEEFPLRCTQPHVPEKCPRDYPTSHKPTGPARTCPSYFKWIHEDLKAWKERGITREMVEGARRTAHFRVVIVDGRVYVEKYKKSIQTRDVFTLWGIMQLLRRYPGKVPDLELLFDCDDRPVIPKGRFQGPNAATPPLFRYCSDQWSFDIVFPDWSFWGW